MLEERMFVNAKRILVISMIILIISIIAVYALETNKRVKANDFSEELITTLNQCNIDGIHEHLCTYNQEMISTDVIDTFFATNNVTYIYENVQVYGNKAYLNAKITEYTVERPLEIALLWEDDAWCADMFATLSEE